MTYARSSAWKSGDYRNARIFEEQVGAQLGDFKFENLAETDRLDFWIPGTQVEVKEKVQKLGVRWHLLPGVPETDLFVIDELSVRRAAQHGFSAYFVIRDRPMDRLFLARVDEVWAVEHVQRNREGELGHMKGKWILDLTNFRQIENLDNLLPLILADQIALNWKRSECLSQKEIPSI